MYPTNKLTPDYMKLVIIILGWRKNQTKRRKQNKGDTQKINKLN